MSFDLATFTERCQQLFAFATCLLGGLAVLQLLENTIAHCFERLHFRLEVLLDTHGNDGIRIEFDHTAVGTIHQHFITEGCLNDLTIGCDAFTTLAPEGLRGLDGQTELLRRLLQVG